VKGGPFARSANEKGEWHGLREHLEAVASLAKGFAENFGTGEWAGLAGWWHDLGKYLPEFQQMLLEVERGQRKRRVDHSSVGAIHVAEFFRPLLAAVSNAEGLEFVQLLLSATIADHHAGLTETRDALAARLEDRRFLLKRVKEQSPPVEVLQRRFPRLPKRLGSVTGTERRLRCEFLVRMVFSALVDADRLDTAGAREADLPEVVRSSVLRSSYASVTTLREVADGAASFAAEFGAGDWGRLAGRWHDLWKSSKAFQTHLAASSSPDLHDADLRGKVHHATVGASQPSCTSAGRARPGGCCRAVKSEWVDRSDAWLPPIRVSARLGWLVRPIRNGSLVLGLVVWGSLAERTAPCRADQVLARHRTRTDPVLSPCLDRCLFLNAG